MDSFEEFMSTQGGQETFKPETSFEEFMKESDTPQEQPIVPKAVDPDSMSSIIGRTVDTLQSNLGGTVEAVGEAVGSEYLQDVGSDFRAKQLEEASQYGQPTIASFKQVDWTDPAEIGSFFKEIGVGGATSLAAIAPAAMAGAKVAPGALKPVGAMAGAFLGSFGLSVGEIQNAIKEVDPAGEHPWSAIGVGAGMAALDAVGIGTMIKPFLKTFGKEVVYQNLKAVGVPKEMAIQAIKTGATESGTEGLQSLTKDITVSKATDTELNVDSVIENAINNAIGGATVGGVAGGTTGLATGIKNNTMIAGTAAPQADLTEGRTAPRNAGHKVLELLGTASSEALKPLSRVSPTARSILERFVPDKTGATASAPTIFEDNDLLVGKYRTQLEGILKGTSRKKLFEEYLSGSKSPKAIQLKGLMDSFRQEAINAGMEVGAIENFLPTTLNQKKVKANRDQAIKDFTPFFGNDATAAARAIDAWLELKEVDRGEVVPKVDQMLEQDPTTGAWTVKSQYQKAGDPNAARYKFAQGYIPPKYGHLEQGRMFANVPQAVLEKYVKEQKVNDKVAALYDYFEGGAHRINFVKNFGSTGEKLNAAILQASNEAQQKGRAVTKDEVNRFYQLADAYNGMLNPIHDKVAKTALSAANATFTMAALPLSTISSLSETFLPAVRGDLQSAIAAAGPAIGQITHDLVRTAFRYVDRTEFSKVASEANITLGAAMNITAERLGTNLMSRGAARAMNAFFLVNGLTLWTHFVRVYAAKTADIIIKRNLLALSGGLPTDSAKGRQYVNQLQSIGIPVANMEDAKALYNPSTESERALANHYRTLGIRRFTSQTVLEPNVANTPMWMHDGHWQILAGLQRYPSAFTNEILPQFVRKARPSYQGGMAGAMSGAIGSLFLIGLIMSVGYLQDELKQMAKGAGTVTRDNRTELQRFLDVANSTVMPIHIGKLTDVFSAQRYGSDPASVLVGPTVAGTLKVASSIGSFVDNPQEGIIWKTAVGLTPAAPFKAMKEASAEIDLIEGL